jgi:ribosomal peptide maturation radical SAM protein 1
MRDSTPQKRAAIIVPPFASIERPALGPHVLQAQLADAGYKIDIIYANLHFAKEVGEEKYIDICYGNTGSLAGEICFSEAAWGKGFEKKEAPHRVNPNEINRLKSPSDQSGREVADETTAQLALLWSKKYARALAQKNYDVVGFNLMFEQTNAAISIINILKELNPKTTIIMGGPLCDGALAEGVLALSPKIDFVFSGESEASLTKFFDNFLSGKPSKSREVITGSPNNNLEALPNVNYDDYFDQFREVMPNSRIISDNLFWLPYESSRGCWWGQKHHCTFCGINGTGMGYRFKSASKVISELDGLRRYGAKRLLMVDNIMPHGYFQTLLPNLATAKLGYEIFYEQKANITYEKMRLIAEAGINMIQPGIEALSDELLALMKKGVRADQNIATLRYASMLDVFVNWNLLYAFPNDDVESYREMTDLVPLLEHLAPPSGLSHLSVDRFSPYFDRSSEYGISSIWPMNSYFDAYPSHIDVETIAYHFEGDYSSACREYPEVLEELKWRIDFWIKSWTSVDDDNPALRVLPISSENFILIDTRKIAKQNFTFINTDQASVSLTGYGSELSRKWAIENLACVNIGERYVPLATTTPELFEAFLARTGDSDQAMLRDFSLSRVDETI